MKMKFISGIACTMLLLTFSACSGGNGNASPSSDVSPSAEDLPTDVSVSDDSLANYEDYTLADALAEYPNEENVELGIIIMDSLLADPTEFVKTFAESETHELVYLLIGATVAENLQYGDSGYLNAVNSADTDTLSDSEKEVYQNILNNIESAKAEYGFDS